MKKKIIIAVSVVLLVAVLITGWVFWKMSKNPDKNPSETEHHAVYFNSTMPQ